MRAAYWTQIGAVLIPLGVSWIALFPDQRVFASVLIVAGFCSFAAGWVLTVRDDVRKQKQEKQRQKEAVMFMWLAGKIAEKLGVDIEQAVKDIKGKLNEHDL